MNRVTKDTIDMPCSLCGTLSTLKKYVGAQHHQCKKCHLHLSTDLTQEYIDGVANQEGYKEEQE